MNLAHVSICPSMIHNFFFFFFNFGDFSAAICVGHFMIDGRWKEIFSEIETKQLILVGKFDLNLRKE